MARNIKTIVLKTSTDNKETWKDHAVIETPTMVPETVEEEECSEFGSEYKDRLPTVKDRDLMTIKVRDDGDSVIHTLPIGCVLDFNMIITYSDRGCGNNEDTVVKDLEFVAYIQKRDSDTVSVNGDRIAALNLTLRLKTAMVPKGTEVPPEG